MVLDPEQVSAVGPHLLELARALRISALVYGGIAQAHGKDVWAEEGRGFGTPSKRL